jgi:protein-L-isoaspartate(D-aspartate) O-methyltransferase
VAPAAGDSGIYERRRMRMVREQILLRGLDDPPLLEAFLAVPRHLYVDEALAARAYADSSVPIGCGQTLSQPYVIARMIHLLGIDRRDRVLEIGTGSGYEAALLARLAGSVHTVERLESLATRARGNWERAGAEGIRIRTADGSLGWPEEAPFTAILVGAASPSVPPTLLGQLAPGGRMVIPVGSAVRQVLKRLVRTERGARVEDHDPCSFVRLVGREGFEA